MSRSIVIVDEDKDAAELLQSILVNADLGYVCFLCEDLDSIESLLTAHKVDTILFDNDSSNEFLLKRIKNLKMKYSHVQMLLLAKDITEEQSSVAREHYVDACCLKGDDYPELINTIEGVI